MDAEEYAIHKLAHEAGLLTVLPHPETGWDQIPLPTSFLSSSGLRTDVVRSAVKAAENTGTPQRIIVKGEIGGVEVSTQEIVQVNYRTRAAIRGLTRSGNYWDQMVAARAAKAAWVAAAAEKQQHEAEEVVE